MNHQIRLKAIATTVPAGVSGGQFGADIGQMGAPAPSVGCSVCTSCWVAGADLCRSCADVSQSDAGCPACDGAGCAGHDGSEPIVQAIVAAHQGGNHSWCLDGCVERRFEVDQLAEQLRVAQLRLSESELAFERAFRCYTEVASRRANDATAAWRQDVELARLTGSPLPQPHVDERYLPEVDVEWDEARAGLAANPRDVALVERVAALQRQVAALENPRPLVTAVGWWSRKERRITRTSDEIGSRLPRSLTYRA